MRHSHLGSRPRPLFCLRHLSLLCLNLGLASPATSTHTLCQHDTHDDARFSRPQHSILSHHEESAVGYLQEQLCTSSTSCGYEHTNMNTNMNTSLNQQDSSTKLEVDNLISCRTTLCSHFFIFLTATHSLTATHALAADACMHAHQHVQPHCAGRMVEVAPASGHNTACI